MITQAQIKHIHGLLPAAIKYNQTAKQEVIVQFTGDQGKTSTKDLSFDQANEIIKRFGGTAHTPTRNKYGYFDKTNKQHKKMLSICYELNWLTHKEGVGLIPDKEALGEWLQKYGYLKKPLKEYTATELPKLVSQFENLLNK